MNRRMLQTALVSGAFGVVAVAGLAVAQPAQPAETPEEALAAQEARAAQDDGLEVEDLLVPEPAEDAPEMAETTAVEDETTETAVIDGSDGATSDTDAEDDLDSDDTDSADDLDSDDTDSADDTDADVDDSVDSLDSDDS